MLPGLAFYNQIMGLKHSVIEHYENDCQREKIIFSQWVCLHLLRLWINSALDLCPGVYFVNSSPGPDMDLKKK